MATQRVYSKEAREAAVLLGQHIKLGRKQRRWSERELADRAGIARATLQKIESGDMSCAIGLAFEVGTLVDVNLFEQDKDPISKHIQQVKDKIALLPQRVRTKTKAVNEDF